MLKSVKIARRQSEIRQALAALVGKEDPTADETRQIETLDAEFRNNEVRYRGALIAEDTERRAHGDDLETRGEREYAALIGRFELRQAMLFLDEAVPLTGATAEIVQEMRSRNGYRGVPIPLEVLALETRAGETVASGVPSPLITAPIIDRLFPTSVAAKMGALMVSIPQGSEEYPIVSSAVAAAWQATETGAVGGPTPYTTAPRTIAPNNTLGIQAKLTRKAIKQAGPGMEQALRRDLNGAMAMALDNAAFQGAGASGQPAGIMVGSYGITSTAVAAAATWAAFRSAVVNFIIAAAANSPGDVNLLIRPEVYNKLDGTILTNTAVSEWDRLKRNISDPVMSANALPAPTGSPLATSALLTTSIGGVPPIFIGAWGGIDLIRDIYSDAQVGGVRLTALLTADVAAGRSQQLQILTGIQ